MTFENEEGYERANYLQELGKRDENVRDFKLDEWLDNQQIEI
jgi:hypothetical protein